MPKSREQLLNEYEVKYGHIPKDYTQRLSWLYDSLHIIPSKAEEIISKRDSMLLSLQYFSFQVILYEEPDGAKRPRFRLVNRKNLANMALHNPDFIHVYSPNAHQDSLYMKRLLTQDDFIPLQSLIITPCQIDINTYFKTPSYYNSTDTILSEVGMIRPISYPDWDNIGKKYSDMFNANIWLDDNLVIDGAVHKYYSILPRVEININYLNMVYTKQQYDRIIKRKDYSDNMNVSYYGMGEK